jgi:hypothetical protein
MKVGFTGTREGMTPQQKAEFVIIITELDMEDFHHGDCTGSDEEAHNWVKELKDDINIVIHPPCSKDYRACCKGNLEIKPKPYLDRNKDIVDACDILIATPQDKEKLRSGTWSTIRYARKLGKDIYIIYPNGTVKREIRNEMV